MSTFFISDLHLGHKRIIEFTDSNGNRIRPFDSINEHDEFIVDSWNSVVNNEDVVWVLGDIVLGDRKKDMSIIAKMKGRKKLVLGNHDKCQAAHYLGYFEELYGMVAWKRKTVLTHAPLHTNQLDRWKLNIHGHMHHNLVLDKDGKPDKRYLNVACEQLGYTPINWQKIVDTRLI